MLSANKKKRKRALSDGDLDKLRRKDATEHHFVGKGGASAQSEERFRVYQGRKEFAPVEKPFYSAGKRPSFAHVQEQSQIIKERRKFTYADEQHRQPWKMVPPTGEQHQQARRMITSGNQASTERSSFQGEAKTKTEEKKNSGEESFSVGSKSNFSFLRTIPLQQLRALARAAHETSPSVGTLPPGLLFSRENSSLKFSTINRGEFTAQTKNTLEQFSERLSGAHKAGEGEDRHSQRRRDITPVKSLKKSSNKKQPAEVSSRRPHFATGQPLLCTSILSTSSVDQVSIAARVPRHMSRGSGGNVSPIRNNSSEKNQKEVRDTCEVEAELAQTATFSGGNSRPGRSQSISADSPLRCRKEAAEMETCTEVLISSAIIEKHTVGSIGGRLAKESDADGIVAERHTSTATEDELRAQYTVSDKKEGSGDFLLRKHEALDEGKRGNTQKEREAAIQRHVKSLRSLRARLAAHGNRGDRERAHMLRDGREAKDPRFSEACGPLDLRMVGKAYSFLNDMRKQEAEHLKRLIKRRRRSGSASSVCAGGSGKVVNRAADTEMEAARIALQRLQSQEETRKRKAVELAVKTRLAREEKARIAQTGKKPFFFRQKEVTRLVQAELQATRESGTPAGQRKAAKQEEKKARKKLAKERRLNAVPVRRAI